MNQSRKFWAGSAGYFGAQSCMSESWSGADSWSGSNCLGTYSLSRFKDQLYFASCSGTKSWTKSWLGKSPPSIDR